MSEHTFLVAVTIEGNDREHAEARLQTIMPIIDEHGDGVPVEWWVAEDDRRDGSDCSSAVFVTAGRQVEAREALNRHDLLGEPDYGRFKAINEALTGDTLDLAILAVNTIAEPDATDERDWLRLVDNASTVAESLAVLKGDT